VSRIVRFPDLRHNGLATTTQDDRLPAVFVAVTLEAIS
jgi:hypothetical protein